MTNGEKYEQEQISNIQKMLGVLGISMTIENINKLPDAMKKYEITEKKCYCEVYFHHQIINLKTKKLEFDANGDCKECGLRNHKL